jgi:hypothetical protein
MSKLFVKTKFVFSLPATCHLPDLSLRACLQPACIPACFPSACLPALPPCLQPKLPNCMPYLRTRPACLCLPAYQPNACLPTTNRMPACLPFGWPPGRPPPPTLIPLYLGHAYMHNHVHIMDAWKNNNDKGKSVSRSLIIKMYPTRFL